LYPTENSENAFLMSLAESLRTDYVQSTAADPWMGSPYSWIRSEPSRTVGKIGEQLVAGWTAARDFDVAHCHDSQADLVINSHRVEVKFSTLWTSGIYKFQQIRDQNYEYCVCLGISPRVASCWILPKSVLLQYLIGHNHGQHTGASGTDTSWISFRADQPLPWMNNWGGSLVAALQVMKREFI
jgi:hypothetical protein